MMTKFRNKYRSESHRWQFWDYSAQAAYFITSVTINRICHFGNVVNGKMILSDFGKILHDHFNGLSENNDKIILDEYVIMPNHFHCILIIPDNEFVYPNEYKFNETDNFILTNHVDAFHEMYLRGIERSKLFYTNNNFSGLSEQDRMAKYIILRRKMLIPKIIGKIKMQVSKQINIANNTPGAPNWQHNYYDEILRFTDDFFRVKTYIKTNPESWTTDRLK